MAYRFFRRAAAVWLVGFGGACGWLGCNAIAGIQLGTLESPTGDGGVQGAGNDAQGAGNDAQGGGNDATTMTMPGDGGDDVNSSDSGGSTKNDAAPSDSGSGGNDAGGDAATPFTTYSCKPSGASPFLVDNLQNADAGRNYDTRIALGVTTNQEARIVAEIVTPPTSTASQNEVFRSYDVQWQPKQVTSTVPVIASQGSHVAGTVNTANGITQILTQGYYDQDSGSSFTTVSAYSLPANVQNLQYSAPPPYQLTTPVAGSNQSATALEMGTDDQFLVTNSGPLQSNRASRDGGPTTPITFANAGPTQGGNDATLVLGGSNVYAVYGGNPSSDASTLVYKLPSSGANTQLVMPSLLPAGTLLAAAQPSTVDATKIATYAATLVTSPSPVFSLFTGLVDDNAFDQLSVSALTAGPSLTLHDVPASKSSQTFVGDSLVLIGLSPVSSDNGMNFIWVDTSARVLAQVVGDSRLYSSRPGIQTCAIAPAPNGIAGVLMTFWVAWTEEQSDTSGTYDILYLDQVQCAAN